MSILFTPVQVGRYTLRNRMVMSPMTRSRSDDHTGVPSDLVPIYYGQRAGAGMIITEGTAPSAMGKGYLRTPGIYSEEQILGWRKVTDAVHARGALIFLQLMHCGRISHTSMLPGAAQPIAPSAVKATGQAVTNAGMQDFSEPRALSTEEVSSVVGEFASATRNSLAAGFDGVELHAASGYLPEQFLSSGTNKRTDAYGGSLENRTRFVLEVLQAMIGAAGANRVGIKIAPEMNYNDIADQAPRETYPYLVEQIDQFKLAYLHVQLYGTAFDYHSLLRPIFGGAYLHGAGLIQETAEALIESRNADAAVFGKLFLANPDLPERFLSRTSLNVPNKSTFYSPGPVGYTDYPAVPDRGHIASRSSQLEPN